MSRRPPHPTIDDAVSVDEMMMQIYALTRIFNNPNETGLQSNRAMREGLAFLATLRDPAREKHKGVLSWESLREYTHAVLLALADKIDGNLVDGG